MSGGGTEGSGGRVESVSTRIALDEGTSTCTDCGATIDAGVRHKVAAVREHARIEHRPFCGRDCLDRWSAAAPTVE